MKRVFFKTIGAAANQSGAMEPETISKNGASLKSRMSRGKFLAILSAILVISTFNGFSQKLTGNLSPLKDQKEVNVVIDFSESTAEGLPQDKYIEIKTKDKTDEEKAKFITELNEQLQNDGYKLYVEKMNKVVQEKLFSAGDYPNAEYTIYVKVTDIRPGTFLVSNSRVAAEISFVKTGETEPFAKVANYSIMGRYASNVPVWVTRVAMAYGYLGDNNGKLILKNLK